MILITSKVVRTTNNRIYTKQMRQHTCIILAGLYKSSYQYALTNGPSLLPV